MKEYLLKMTIQLKTYQQLHLTITLYCNTCNFICLKVLLCLTYCQVHIRCSTLLPFLTLGNLTTENSKVVTERNEGIIIGNRQELTRKSRSAPVPLAQRSHRLTNSPRRLERMKAKVSSAISCRRYIPDKSRSLL